MQNTSSMYLRQRRISDGKSEVICLSIDRITISAAAEDRGFPIGDPFICRKNWELKEQTEDCKQRWMSSIILEETIICEKARAIYEDLLKQTPQTTIDEASEESFKASRGWFENFEKRSGIHSVVRHGEAASSDMKAAEDYIKTFSDLIKAQG
ncbi:hypothetical protein LAZ67_8002083 [Cordylochernes scorpioides]|uniref:HTH CENPB-type domain-containing protein n=1 Tax=Cordylochernes scorpioides TaxID=51811 RepID=A0ABY6KSN2_9ARAC|nr:hypothetical protein LAZ67_8002083 [Cordylochernes scorpioides]